MDRLETLILSVIFLQWPNLVGITTAHPWEVSCGALIPISILIGLQGFAQTACYSVHHKGLLRDVSLIYYLAYQA